MNHENTLIDPAETTPPPGTPGPGPDPVSASLLQQFKALARELPGIINDRVELLSLELQRATQSLVEIVALLVAVSILGVTVWLLVWAGVIGGLVAAGLQPLWALLLAIALNVLAVLLAVQRVKRLLPRLKLPATRRHLMFSPDPTPQDPSEDRPDDRPAAAPARQPDER
jgi:hypothetical protein